MVPKVETEWPIIAPFCVGCRHVPGEVGRAGQSMLTGVLNAELAKVADKQSNQFTGQCGHVHFQLSTLRCFLQQACLLSAPWRHR